VLVLGALPAHALPHGEFGSEGSGAGQFSEPAGIALNQGNANIYIADRNNNRIDEFTGDGVFVRTWGWGVADGATEAFQTCTNPCFLGVGGPGSGQFEGPEGVAVDNDPLSPSFEDVYVVDKGNRRVEKFTPSGEFLLTFGGEVNENGTNVCFVGEKCRAGKEGTGNGEFRSMFGAIAVDTSGNVFVGDRERVQQFSPAGVYLSSLPVTGVGGETTLQVAVNSAGDIYTISGNRNGSSSGVQEYEPSGSLLRTLNLEGGPSSITLDASGDLFVNDNATGRINEYNAAGEVLLSFKAGNGREGIAFRDTTNKLYLLNSEAVAMAPLPPPGPEFEGVEAAAEPAGTAVVRATIDPEGKPTKYHVEYGLEASNETATTLVAMAAEEFAPELIEVKLTSLQPAATYHFHLIAENASGTTEGADETFTTLPPSRIDSESVTDVKSTSATLGAQINPLGSDTTYHFSYGPTPACGGEECTAPTPDGDVGSGTAPVEVAPEHLQGLTPGTTYNYRVIAHNTLGTVEGEVRTFTTQISGEAGLPDGRGWELVSPPDKHGANILTFTSAGAELFQAAASGDAITWPATAPTEARPQGNSLIQVLSARGRTGWSSLDLDIPHAEATGANVEMENAFFSEDLSLGLLVPFGSFQPSLSAQASEQTPYLRTNYPSGDPNHRCNESCFRPLVTGCPAEGQPCPAPVKESEDVPPGTVFGGETDGECSGGVCGPRFIGATPDLSHVMIVSEVALTATGIPNAELYEWANGRLSLVSLLPPDEEGNEDPAIRVGLGFNNIVMTHAISSDGSRVFWEAENTLYMRDMIRKETIMLGPDPFEGANAEGSRAFYAGHECEVRVSKATSKLECTNVGEPYGQLLGTSEDGSWVYSEQAGDVSVTHAGKTTLIAAEVGGLRASESIDLTVRHWRVSPNGEWFAFMSNSPLTGYDNHDAVSGVPDEEVFLYNTRAERLVCASCDPTGARPEGVGSGPVVGGWPDGTWIAASVPGWTPYVTPIALYHSRYLSNQGRLFFNGSDALVPKDVNSQQDVYEFEPEGTPAGIHACVRGTSSGSVVFEPLAGGCVGLISSGQSPAESTFVDASETGSDVFFESTATDLDGSLSLFDAHECTPGSPCLVPPAAQPLPCDTEASCKTSPTPQPTIFGASGSATFSGAGNLPSPPVLSGSLTRAQKLSKALKACRAKHNRRARSSCARQAKKKYGPTKTKARKAASRRRASS
jgi:DNA-binding beta-propeller fold protein YncE